MIGDTIGWAMGTKNKDPFSININLDEFYNYIRNWDNLCTKLYNDDNKYNPDNGWEKKIFETNPEIFKKLNFGVTIAHSSTKK
mmetsp:Transcript_56963/g.51249  ORF Transcript_56963/g.51249 Transcript_56963/m.51249 type:complete len:83 (+) Transcript_56963:3-251(+)